jgi:hypothetical protein
VGEWGRVDRMQLALCGTPSWLPAFSDLKKVTASFANLRHGIRSAFMLSQDEGTWLIQVDHSQGHCCPRDPLHPCAGLRWLFIGSQDRRRGSVFLGGPQWLWGPGKTASIILCGTIWLESYPQRISVCNPSCGFGSLGLPRVPATWRVWVESFRLRMVPAG